VVVSVCEGALVFALLPFNPFEHMRDKHWRRIRSGWMGVWGRSPRRKLFLEKCHAERANILTKLQDLLLYLNPQLNKFPRDQKFVLGDRDKCQSSLFTQIQNHCRHPTQPRQWSALMKLTPFHFCLHPLPALRSALRYSASSAGKLWFHFHGRSVPNPVYLVYPVNSFPEDKRREKKDGVFNHRWTRMNTDGLGKDGDFFTAKYSKYANRNWSRNFMEGKRNLPAEHAELRRWELQTTSMGWGMMTKRRGARIMKEKGILTTDGHGWTLMGKGKRRGFFNHEIVEILEQGSEAWTGWQDL
jgi:hypothetical protein